MTDFTGYISTIDELKSKEQLITELGFMRMSCARLTEQLAAERKAREEAEAWCSNKETWIQRVEDLEKINEKLGDPSLYDQFVSMKKRAEAAEAQLEAVKSDLDHETASAYEQTLRVELAEARVRELDTAKALINWAVEIMTPDQVGQWEGVRSWLEQT